MLTREYYLPAKFHLDPICNDEALIFFLKTIAHSPQQEEQQEEEQDG